MVGENFADKWNRDSRLPTAFYVWHKEVFALFDLLVQLEGKDRLSEELQESFGATQEVVRHAMTPFVMTVGNARAMGSLLVARSLGVVTAPAAGRVNVRPNTFFGR
jgi:hypothetical protein